MSLLCTRPTILLAITLLATLDPASGQVSFSAPVSYTVGTNPGNIITADFNGDGVPDVAVANNGDLSVSDLGSISVLLGNGDGTFQPALDVPAGAFPAIILAGDFNGDGKLDLFVEGEPSNNATLVPWSVLFGRGDGSFGAPAQIALVSPGPLAVGDFNSDGKLDLIFGDPASGDLKEATGNGDGTFLPAQAISTLALGQIIAADFNGDGNLDLAVAGREVLLGNGDGTFQPPLSLSLNGDLFPNFLASDLNRDGKADLIAFSKTYFARYPPGCELICSSLSTYHLEVHLSARDWSFQPVADIVTTSTATAYGQKLKGDAIGGSTVGDFDGDGLLDVAYLRSTYANGVLVSTSLVVIGGKGDGTFPSDLGTVSGTFGNSGTTDLNGDKLADLGAAPLTSNTIGVVLNTTPSFWLGAPAAIGPLRAGGSATATVAVNSQNGFSNAVSLTCSAPLSAGIQCSLSSSTLARGASSTLTVTTTGNSATLFSPANRLHPEWLYVLCLPLGAFVFTRVGFAWKRSARSRLVAAALGCLLVVGIFFEVACGGGGKKLGRGSTPAGTYTITVTGTSGVTQHSTTMKLTVQ